MTTLPIDAVVEEIASAHERDGAVVVEATPGAGKTTRVPPAIAGGARSVVVLEPRRLAARLAAERVAEELGERVGQTVGYQVRFDVKRSRQTRILFMTEAVLTRRVMQDPALRGVDTVIVDEVHERNLHTDLALALTDHLRRTTRPDLGLVIMSATLDGEAIAKRYDAARVRSEQRMHEVVVDHFAQRSREPLDVEVAAAVRRLCEAGLDGHVLVFLPGVREIREAHARCAGVAKRYDLEVLPLHGRLTAAEQDRAVAPSKRTKVILATNVAESSITIPNVAAVIDSGLARTPRWHAWSSAPTLETGPISQASAKQRAGRAGRTRAGRCLRLYTERDLQRAPAFDTPEIERVDLCELALAVAAAGAPMDALRWLSPPPAELWQQARRVLREMGAVDDAITEVGRSMLRFATHPRLARALVEGESLGVGTVVAQIAAVASEGTGQQTDVWRRIEQVGRSQTVKRTCAQLSRPLSDASAPDDLEAAVGAAMLTGFRDRLAKRVGDGADLALADGGRAKLSNRTALGHHAFAIVLDAMAFDNAPAKVRLAMPVHSDWILEALIDDIEDTRDHVWNDERKRVDVLERMTFRSLVLDEVRKRAEPGDDTAAVLLEAAWRAGVQRSDAIDRLRARLAWIDAPLDDSLLKTTLTQLCGTVTTLADLEAMGLAAAISSLLAPATRARLQREAPARLRLANGTELVVQYPPDRDAYVASYMQDFFGLPATPRLAGKPLLIHLWAPNKRAEQVTTDLASFWQTHYPAMHKRLSRRYPKHHWPTEPVTAKPVRLRRYL